MIEYDPAVFDVTGLEQAKNIILTPQEGLTPDERWETETPYFLSLMHCLNLNENSRVIDYGCGAGRMAKALIDRYGCNVTGVDISQSMLEIAREYVGSSRFETCKPEQLRHVYDAAISIWCLQHCFDVRQDIQRIHGALKLNGKLFVVNEKQRFIPTRIGWGDDRVNVEQLLSETFVAGETNVLDPSVIGEQVSRNVFCRTYKRANKANGKAADNRYNWAAICRCGGVGDNLVAASVCRPLKEAGYSVEVITQKPNSVLFENNPHIDKISVYEPQDWPVDQARWQEWFHKRAREYKKFANFGHSMEARHALFPVQTWFWWPQEYRRKLCAGSYLETAHDIIGVPHSFGPLFFPTEEEKEKARDTRSKLGRPLIAWCLSGTRVDKVYPYTPLVIARLIKELNATVVMLAAPPPHRDFEIAKLTMESVKATNGTIDGLHHAGSPDLQNETWPVRRILAFAAICDLYIGGDTGPSWGVAFEQVPKIIMISHASVENITKHWINTLTLHADPQRVPCWPCHRLHENFEHCHTTKLNDGDFASCISDINSESIVSNAARLLNGKAI